MANETNALAAAYRVEIDAQFNTACENAKLP